MSIESSPTISTWVGVFTNTVLKTGYVPRPGQGGWGYLGRRYSSDGEVEGRPLSGPLGP